MQYNKHADNKIKHKYTNSSADQMTILECKFLSLSIREIFLKNVTKFKNYLACESLSRIYK